MRALRVGVLHTVLCTFGALTLLPFFFVIVNSFRTNTEMYHSFFGVPGAAKSLLNAVSADWSGQTRMDVEDDEGVVTTMTPREAIGYYAQTLVKSYPFAWRVLRNYMFNTFLVCGATAAGVVIMASVSAYILSRYRFFGSKVIFYLIIGVMMFPGVLTFVPSFMLVRDLGLLNTYWAMILPYMAGGQAFALYVFKSFFDGLPEDLFESARIDGAGHFQLYLNIVLPLSKSVLSVVVIMSVFGTWNNFLWPFVTNTDGKLHVVSSGLYVLAVSTYSSNAGAQFAAFIISSVPLLVLFTYATKPFIQGITSGAFKA